MKWYSTYKHPEGLYFVIEDGINVGFYLYVYEEDFFFEEDIKDPEYCRCHQQDHLQDTFEIAQEQAEEDFGVPMDSWVKVKS